MCADNKRYIRLGLGYVYVSTQTKPTGVPVAYQGVGGVPLWKSEFCALQGKYQGCAALFVAEGAYVLIGGVYYKLNTG